MASRPKTVTVYYRGIPYQLDLVACRKALVQSQIDGELDSMESLSGRVGISRSTASRFFSGRATSLAVTLRILDALRLGFDDVARPINESDDPESGSNGAPGAGAKGQPKPNGDRGGAARQPGNTSGQ